MSGTLRSAKRRLVPGHTQRDRRGSVSRGRLSRLWHAGCRRQSGRRRQRARSHASPRQGPPWPFRPMASGWRRPATAARFCCGTRRAGRRQEVTFAGNPKNLLSVCFSPDSTKLAAGGGTFPPQTLLGEAAVWNVATGERVIAATKSAAIMEVQFAPDGRHLVTACLDTRADFWELSTGDKVRSFRDPGVGPEPRQRLPQRQHRGHAGARLGHQAVRSGRRAAACSLADRQRRDARPGHFARRQADHQRRGRSPGAAVGRSDVRADRRSCSRATMTKRRCRRFSRWPRAPDGSIVAMGREDGSIVLRDAASGKFCDRWSGTKTRSPACCFCPTGARWSPVVTTIRSASGTCSRESRCAR